MTLDEFKAKFAEIKAQGFIRTKRKGPTGIGQTFEKELGLKENNLALPDIDKFEIKCHREGSSA